MLVYPLDFVQTRLQTDIGRKGEKQYKGMLDCFLKNFNKDGLAGIYAGCSVSALTYFSYRGL